VIRRQLALVVWAASGDGQNSGQVHRGQMGGNGGLFMGVLRHGDLIDQSLFGSLEVHQGQGLFGFGLLQFHRGIHRPGGLCQRRNESEGKLAV